MDTRWTKFKYSNFSKLLCVLLACCFISVFSLNFIKLTERTDTVGSQNWLATSQNNDDFEKIYFSSEKFSHLLINDVEVISYDVSHNYYQALYDEKKAETSEKMLEYFKKVQPYVIAQAEQEQADREADDDYDYEENGEETTTHIYSEYALNNVANYNFQYGVSSSGIDTEENTFGFYYDYTDENLNETIEIYFKVPIYADEATALNSFKLQFGNHIYYYYCANYAEAGESARLNLDKVKFYAEFADGSTVGNVENGEEFKAGVRSGNYFIIENGVQETGGNVSVNSNRNIIDYISHSTDMFNNIKLYISLDNAYEGNDKYGELGVEVQRSLMQNPVSMLALCIISVIGLITMAVFSIRLAGHKNGEIKTAFIDKMPVDLHFILSGVIAVLLAFCYVYTMSERFGFDLYNSVNYFAASFDESDFILALICAEGCGIYLAFIEFCTSVARSVKAKERLFGRTMIFGFYKILRFCFKKLKRLFAKIKRYFKTLFFAPKKLGRGTVAVVGLYTGINIFVMLIAMMMNYNHQGLFAAFIIMLLIVADAFLIYKAFCYMRSLDKIIDCAQQNIPVEIDEKDLTPSLKALADALDKKTADLQSVVIKAVKDERTKAELITNVSHDLKTPLTSVINYIDLLKKCDIEDETARQYMQVIDEKSIKLKRLIEDLIEASKVSAGNVTLNKTKINLNELAAQAIVEETADIEKRGLQIIFEEPTEKNIVFADGTKLYRVFENLLSNARKYSAPGSRIYAQIRSDNDFGYFEIKNISKEPLNISAEELTERFVRGDKSRSEDGNGLGLSIAKQLCVLNGGELIITIDGDLFKATVKMPRREQPSNEQ